MGRLRSGLLLRLADVASLVEDHTPAAVRLEPPDRRERADELPGGIPDGAARQGEGSGIEDLDRLRLPGERRLSLLEEPSPRRDHRVASSEGAAPVEEDPLLGDVARE